ncbi:hypothetical protein Tco_1207593 [Tanacetum coccineum]
METIHVKFDELTAMASECNNLEPGFNYSNFQDSLEESKTILSKEDLDSLFGPLYEEYYVMRSLEVSDNFATNTLDNEEYYVTRSLEVSDNFAANTLDNEDTPSIVVEENEDPQIVASSEEPITTEPTTPVLNNNTDESVQKDGAELDGSTIMNPF